MSRRKDVHFIVSLWMVAHVVHEYGWCNVVPLQMSGRYPDGAKKANAHSLGTLQVKPTQKLNDYDSVHFAKEHESKVNGLRQVLRLPGD